MRTLSRDGGKLEAGRSARRQQGREAHGGPEVSILSPCAQRSRGCDRQEQGLGGGSSGEGWSGAEELRAGRGGNMEGPLQGSRPVCHSCSGTATWASVPTCPQPGPRGSWPQHSRVATARQPRRGTSDRLNGRACGLPSRPPSRPSLRSGLHAGPGP